MTSIERLCTALSKELESVAALEITEENRVQIRARLKQAFEDLEDAIDDETDFEWRMTPEQFPQYSEHHALIEQARDLYRAIADDLAQAATIAGRRNAVAAEQQRRKGSISVDYEYTTWRKAVTDSVIVVDQILSNVSNRTEQKRLLKILIGIAMATDSSEVPEIDLEETGQIVRSSHVLPAFHSELSEPVLEEPEEWHDLLDRIVAFTGNMTRAEINAINRKIAKQKANTQNSW